MSFEVAETADPAEEAETVRKGRSRESSEPISRSGYNVYNSDGRWKSAVKQQEERKRLYVLLGNPSESKKRILSGKIKEFCKDNIKVALNRNRRAIGEENFSLLVNTFMKRWPDIKDYPEMKKDDWSSYLTILAYVTARKAKEIARAEKARAILEAEEDEEVEVEKEVEKPVAQKPFRKAESKKPPTTKAAKIKEPKPKAPPQHSGTKDDKGKKARRARSISPGVEVDDAEPEVFEASAPPGVKMGLTSINVFNYESQIHQLRSCFKKEVFTLFLVESGEGVEKSIVVAFGVVVEAMDWSRFWHFFAVKEKLYNFEDDTEHYLVYQELRGRQILVTDEKSFEAMKKRLIILNPVEVRLHLTSQLRWFEDPEAKEHPPAAVGSKESEAPRGSYGRRQSPPSPSPVRSNHSRSQR